MHVYVCVYMVIEHMITIIYICICVCMCTYIHVHKIIMMSLVRKPSAQDRPAGRCKPVAFGPLGQHRASPVNSS